MGRACETRQKPHGSGFAITLPNGRHKLLVTRIHNIFLKLNNPGGVYIPVLRQQGLDTEDIINQIYKAKKLANRLFPADVNMDSGWNCTPHTGKVLCRIPIISS